MGEVLRARAAAAFGEAPEGVHLCFGTVMLVEDWQCLRELGLVDGATVTFLRDKRCGPCGYWHREDGVKSDSLKGCVFCNYGWSKSMQETLRIARPSQEMSMCP